MVRSTLRELVWAEMQKLQALGLGVREIKTNRDKFVLHAGHPNATKLATLPEAEGYIRSEPGSLLFRKASFSFQQALPRELRAKATKSDKGLSFHWRDLSDDDIRTLFTIVRQLAGLEPPAA
jgi:hypothetical protein